MKPTDTLSVQEIADLFGFPAEALIQAVQAQRSRTPQPYYSLKDLQTRWRCSRGKVDAILKASNAVALDLRTSKGKAKKSKKVFAAESVARIESERRLILGAA
jgi:hypothetical protein